MAREVQLMQEAYIKNKVVQLFGKRTSDNSETIDRMDKDGKIARIMNLVYQEIELANFELQRKILERVHAVLTEQL